MQDILKNSFLRLGASLVLLSLFVPTVSGQDSTLALSGSWTVERDEQWEALFDRNSGWTGADGIYSIPLSDTNPITSNSPTKTLFVFSDTFIGDVNVPGRRLPGSTLVNNTLALMDGLEPIPEAIDFFWREGSDGSPKAVFVPTTPDANPGDWYWLMDGIALEATTHIFALRMEKADGGVFNFRVAGVSLLSLPLTSPNPVRDHVQADTPLFFAPLDGRGDIILGAAIMANTGAANAPEPDGYVYIYGQQNDPFNKRLIAARVLPEEFGDFSKWRYWDGTAWSPQIENIAPLTGRVSSELSVTPLPNGQFLLVFQLDTLGRDTAIRLGDSPIGPFGGFIRIWQCPEAESDPDIFCYNAKAHPHLSAPGEMLISYNVNTFDFLDHFTFADIYRPRFIRIRRESATP